MFTFAPLYPKYHSLIGNPKSAFRQGIDMKEIPATVKYEKAK